MTYNSLDPGETAVRGFCPMGCGESLHLIEQQILCMSDDCPRPTAVKELLADTETEHLVTFGWAGFSLVHPLRERLDDGVAACELHRYLAGALAWPESGKYRVGPSADGGWAFERLES